MHQAYPAGGEAMKDLPAARYDAASYRSPGRKRGLAAVGATPRASGDYVLLDRLPLLTSRHSINQSSGDADGDPFTSARIGQ